MSKAKVKVIGEKLEVDNIDLSSLTVDCHGVEYTAEQEQTFVDVVRSYNMVDIFDLYYDDKKVVKRIWVLGGKLSPKLAEAKIVYKD